ncbi:MAG: membrane-bound lytic murein transglycosylase MltF [Gammaproteobacteria bacterium]|nr:membrane-bound lytic murein transglycosylase MltF [Gammaproteobacteria bacterium]
MRFAIAMLLINACVFLSTCSEPPTLLDTIIERGTLRVVTRNSPTTYYLGGDGPTGPEYEFARAFADELGVELEMYSAPTFDAIIPELLTYRADIAAAGMTVTDARRERLRFTTPYQVITQQVVYRMGAKRPRTIEDLVGRRIAVIAGSSHADTLERLKQQLPALAWTEVPASEGDDLLYWVAQKRIDVTLTDSNEFQISRYYHPELRIAFELGQSDELAWALRRGDDPSLYRLAENFMQQLTASQQAQRTLDKYYGYRGEFDYVGTRRFLRHVESRLPQYQEMFDEAAERVDVDWKLLAAVGYQESHWNPDAVSPTGVRGLMMLTRATAGQLGIENRRDPEASISGGARYLVRVRSKIPERIPEPDRTYMALAAYNVGFGHLEDARVLTQRFGKDPDLWKDVREHLPLLAQRKYYTTVRRGYARGWEPVLYVDNIRRYYDLLQWYFSERNRMYRPLVAEDGGGGGSDEAF